MPGAYVPLTAIRSWLRMPSSIVSPFRRPFCWSAAVCALATFFSSSFERMKSSVELYWSTNAFTVALMFAWFGTGAPTVTVTGPETLVTPFSVSEAPGIRVRHDVRRSSS